jgi:DNA repair protein RadC
MTATTSILNEIKVSYKRKTAGKVITSGDALNYIKPFYEEKVDVQEVFSIILLNRANSIIGNFTVSIGGISGTVVDARLIFSVALKTLASGIILIHNHPSGNLRPSEQDIQITQKLKEGAKLLDLSILDHLILTTDGYLSFADEGMM